MVATPLPPGPRAAFSGPICWPLSAICLVLTKLAQTCRMQLIPGPPVEPWGLVTLRPQTGIHVHLARRVIARHVLESWLRHRLLPL
jgi:hypothetical protein